LIQVMVNLLLNARDAMDGAGIITLTGGEEPELTWITISDSGDGIKKENLQQIFDPFYTTKKSGKGRGLGLSVCQRILKEADGQIEPRSEEGAGAAFKISFRKVELFLNEEEVRENTGCG
jgi:two-component system, NtrC family, sensor kinase